MPRTRIRTLVPWAGAVALLALFATPAAAAIAIVPVAIGPDGGVLVMADEAEPNLDFYFAYSLLREWGNATGTLHNSNSFDIGAMITNLSRSTGTSWMMQGGAVLWMLLQGLYDFALAFEPINGFGAGLDSFTAGIAKIALGPVGIIAIVIAVVIAVFSAVRATRMGGQGGIKRVAGVLVLFAVIGVAGNGAAASTGTGDDYKPGMLSPGWVISTTNSGINTLASGLAGIVQSDFVRNSTDLEWRNQTPVDLGKITCEEYVQGMRADASRVVGSSSNQLTQSRVQLSFLLSDLWSTSGLESYKTVQFGSNVYADKVYCRMLETNASTPIGVQLTRMDAGRTVAENGADEYNGAELNRVSRPQGGSSDKGAAAMNLLSFDNNSNRMAGMTAWAACKTTDWGATWTVDPAWAKEYTKDDKAIQQTDCEQWWNGTNGTDPADIPDIFDVDGTPAGIEKAVSATAEGSNPEDVQAIRDYLLTLNGGWTGGGGSGSALIYLLGSLATIIALGIVCVGTIIAKLLGLFYVLALMLVLIAGLFTANGWNKVKQTTFQMIGSQIFAAGAVLILTFIVIFTNLLMSVGASLFDRGSIWALAWMGLAPAMALIGFNLIFKKVFRLPSPMSIKGGQLWANAAAAGGGGLAGSMLGGMGRGDGDPIEGGSRRLTRAAKEQLQKFGSPQDPSTREGAMGGGKRRTKLANAAAGDAAGAGAVSGGAAAAGAAVGAAAGAAGAAGGETVTVPIGAPAATGTVAEHVAALRHAKAEGRGGLAGAVVLPAVAGAGLLGRGIGAAGKKAFAGHQAIRAGGGYKAATGAALSRGKAGTLAAAKNAAPQWRQARNAQGQMVLKRTTGVGAALDRAREQRFQSLAASRGINFATATRTQLEELRNDSTAGRMVNAAAKARGAKAIADSKAAVKAAPARMKNAALTAPAKVAAGAVKAYNNPKTMSRVKTAAKVGAGAAAIGLTGGLAAAPIAAFAAHKAIGKSRGYLGATRNGEHQADRLQAYRDAHAQETARKESKEADRAARDEAAEKATAAEERIAASVAAKFEAAEAEKQKQAEAKANAEASTAGAGDGSQQPSNPSDQTDYNQEL
ncbi:hypothetical protein [Pseudoclavibacter sp. VKM Ac-2867]|uniref:hypothetical protein n=1 Tax=Pseudoclavibacter sp. VKM Ac-2867 TaxID=2783829 RepID=UPI00188DB5BE|nr:hypothetical protein [Pseudoclavibacter sp. VKM Ac-2867]MBF4459407.1 hypothetical protein [Pseudoclavibacter sp. VKM Ac-2867]